MIQSLYYTIHYGNFAKPPSNKFASKKLTTSKRSAYITVRMHAIQKGNTKKYTKHKGNKQKPFQSKVFCCVYTHAHTHRHTLSYLSSSLSSLLLRSIGTFRFLINACFVTLNTISTIPFCAQFSGTFGCVPFNLNFHRFKTKEMTNLFKNILGKSCAISGWLIIRRSWNSVKQREVEIMALLNRMRLTQFPRFRLAISVIIKNARVGWNDDRRRCIPFQCGMSTFPVDSLNNPGRVFRMIFTSNKQCQILRHLDLVGLG